MSTGRISSFPEPSRAPQSSASWGRGYYPKSRERISLLALDRAGGETGDIVVEEEDVHDHDRDARQQRPRHERAPEVDVAADQVRGDTDHGRLVRRLRDEGERVGELVPAEREAEEHGADDPGDR